MHRQIIPILETSFAVNLELLATKGIPIDFTWSDCPVSNAWARYRPETKSYEIRITEELLKNIHHIVHEKNIFDTAIDKIIKISSMDEAEKQRIKNFLVGIVLHLCFYHELGHVVEGHLELPGGSSQLTENVIGKDTHTPGFTAISLQESQADAYSGIKIAHYMATSSVIPCDKDKNINFLKHITILASQVLFYVLGFRVPERHFPDYPPYIWRLFSVQALFVKNFSALANDAEYRQYGDYIKADDAFFDKHYDRETKLVIRSGLEAINRSGSSADKIFSPRYLVPWHAYYRSHFATLREWNEFIKKKRGISL